MNVNGAQYLNRTAGVLYASLRCVPTKPLERAGILLRKAFSAVSAPVLIQAKASPCPGTLSSNPTAMGIYVMCLGAFLLLSEMQYPFAATCKENILAVSHSLPHTRNKLSAASRLPRRTRHPGGARNPLPVGAICLKMILSG